MQGHAGSGSHGRGDGPETVPECSRTLAALNAEVNKVVERYCARYARSDYAPAIEILQRFLDFLDQAHAIIRERARHFCSSSGQALGEMRQM